MSKAESSTRTKSTSGVDLPFSHKSRAHTMVTNNQVSKEEIEEEIKILQGYSTSYFILIWTLIVGCLFGNLLGLGNTKYIQSKLHGQPSDLATLDLFTNLVTLAAPIGALLMDNFYIFKKKIGPYLFLTQTFEGVCVLCVGLFDPNLESFIFLLSCRAVGGAFNGAIIQGILAHKTQLDIQILDLKEYLRYADRPDFDLETEALSEGGLALRELRDKAGIKVYTIWTLYSALFGGFSSIWCGFAVDKIPIEKVYIMASIPYFLIALITLVIFKEETQESWFPENKNAFVAAKKFSRVIFSPLLLLPIVLQLLGNLTPQTSDAITFIMTNEAGWSFTNLGLANAANVAIITAVVLSLERFRETSTFRMLLLMGTFCLALGRLTTIPLMYPELDLKIFMVFYVLNSMFNELSNIFTVIPIFGRLNSMLPKGFESTGANILDSMQTLAGSLSLMLSKKELNWFKVVNGYYERVNWPMAINFGYTVLICWLCPLFLLSTREIVRKRRKKKNKDEKKKESKKKSIKRGK